MKILKVVPKDIYVTLEMTITEVDQLLEVISRSKVECNSEEDPEFFKALEFVSKEFVAELDRLIIDVKGES